MSENIMETYSKSESRAEIIAMNTYYINIASHDNIVMNAVVYDMLNTMIASGYPMQAEYSHSADRNIWDTLEKAFKRSDHLANTEHGSGHDNFLCGIRVAFDLTFTNKAWIEFERYHFADIVSSQSTMHRIAKMDLDKAYIDYVDPSMISRMKELVTQYNENPSAENYLKVLYSNPAGMKLTARIDTNYRQLKTIYKQRKNHRLPEWRWFCEWIEQLPNSQWIIGEEEES